MEEKHERAVLCPACNGRGELEDGETRAACHTCNATGFMIEVGTALMTSEPEPAAGEHFWRTSAGMVKTDKPMRKATSSDQWSWFSIALSDVFISDPDND